MRNNSWYRSGYIPRSGIPVFLS